MDGLALLCTLHADGPATLKRLRQRGCRNLDDLQMQAPEELAQLLKVAPAVARRLLREAKVLRERIGPGMLEREERPASTVASRSGPPAASPVREEPSQLDRVDRAVLGRVLDRWRGSDAAEENEAQRASKADRARSLLEASQEMPPEMPAGGQMGDIHGQPQPASASENGADEARSAVLFSRRPRASTPTDSPPTDSPPIHGEANSGADENSGHGGQPDAGRGDPIAENETAGRLAAGCLDGLDEGIAGRLAEHGVVHLAHLAEANGLQLATRVGMPFASLLRLQFLARQVVRSEAYESAVPAAAESRSAESGPGGRARRAQDRGQVSLAEAPAMLPAPPAAYVKPWIVQAPPGVLDAESEVRPHDPRVADAILGGRDIGQMPPRGERMLPKHSPLHSPDAASEEQGEGGTVLSWNFEIPRCEDRAVDPATGEREDVEAKEGPAGPFA